MLSSALTHRQPFLHPGQEVFDIPGPGLGVEESGLHPAVMLQQGQVNFFLPRQGRLWPYEDTQKKNANHALQNANVG